MSTWDLIWLIDADPPSDAGGARGFYPASSRTDGPDEGLMRRRFSAISDLVRAETGGAAVLTVHTSPRFRTTFFREPYAALFRDLAAEGVALALHPHEDRADGRSLYADPGHLACMIGETMEEARQSGLAISAFRSGGFAFHPCLPGLLASHGISIDLSAAPGFSDVQRHAVWAPSAWHDRHVLADANARITAIPIGWDGAGTSMDRNYLYNERVDLAGLCRIWDAMQRSTPPRTVNFLTHGFGLVEERWRRQAADFLRHVRATGGRVVPALAREWTTLPPQ